MLGVPLVSPRPRAPSPALEWSLASQSLVSAPQAPPPLTSEPQAGGGSHLSPSRTPEREQAGGSGAKRRQTVAGAQRQPPRASQPAPRWGSRRYSPGPPPSPRPAPLRRGGRTPQPMDTLVQEWEGVPGDLDCGWTGLGLSPRPLPWAQQVR